MPSFITNGPDIPEELLFAHEEGKVVFFCGAGISYPAKLPSFYKLTIDLFKNLGVTPNSLQSRAINNGQFDTAIGLLEADRVGSRERVRQELASILVPNLKTPTSTRTHEALLTLGKSRAGRYRLITTNFDRIFEEVKVKQSLTIPCYQAPLLPTPKNRFDGLVYLHGLLPKDPAKSDLNHLVVSSGDFGLAYLSERWASRFVSELFSNYTVCFVGYSINDPVMRYMMDALAADRLLGESTPKAYAFGGYSKGKEKQSFEEWESKNVIPLLYPMYKSHYHLHMTLHKWAEYYRDGVGGKKMLITQHASSPPTANSKTDFAVGRVLWSLLDGDAAKHFADLQPLPPLSWLQPLLEKQYSHAHLSLFGVTPDEKVDSKLSYNFLSRPSPYGLSANMSLVHWGGNSGQWDDVMFQIARWLLRHMSDPGLFLQIVNMGGGIPPKFRYLMEREIEQFENRNGESEEEQVRGSNEERIVSPYILKLWRLLLSNKIKIHGPDSGNLYDWFGRFKREGLSTTLRIDLKKLLQPCISVRAPYTFPLEEKGADEPPRMKDFVEWDLELGSDHVHAAFRNSEKKEGWLEALPDILPDITVLLRDAFDLMHLMEGADKQSDLSYIHQPSITTHTQNNDFNDWTILVELARDAWVQTAKISPIKAKNTVNMWWQIEYPIFKRLVFFASTFHEIISLERSVSRLLSEEGWWLWSVETQREALQLITSLSPILNMELMELLIHDILIGPPRKMFNAEVEKDDWERIVNREIWLRLAKIKIARGELPEDGRSKLLELEQNYPDWKLSVDEREEFPFWSSDGEDYKKYIQTPSTLKELAAWLKEHPDTDHWHDDDFVKRCRENIDESIGALASLAEENVWPNERWREALNVWASDEYLKVSWPIVAQLLVKAPEKIIHEISHTFGRWLEMQAKVFDGEESLFYECVRKILFVEAAQSSEIDVDDPVFQAINHPVGSVTQALLNKWYRIDLKQNQTIEGDLKELFTQLCNLSYPIYRHARVILASRVLTLYRVDPVWTRTYLLPLFSWEGDASENVSIWEGFLWSPRLYRPLIDEIKPHLISAVEHYEQLGKHSDQLASFMTFIALDRGDSFTMRELSAIFDMFPQNGLESASHTLFRAIEGAGEQKAVYWKNRIAPFIRQVWPKSVRKRSEKIALNFALLSTEAGDYFPEARDIVQDWLTVLEHPDFVVNQIFKAGLCRKFPKDSLKFLNQLHGDRSEWPPRKLRECLEQIIKSDPNVADLPEYESLSAFYDRRRLS